MCHCDMKMGVVIFMLLKPLSDLYLCFNLIFNLMNTLPQKRLIERSHSSSIHLFS